MIRKFRRDVRQATQNPSLQQALDFNTELRAEAARKARALLPDLSQSRRRAHAIRQETIEHLDQVLATFVRNAEANGLKVHRVADARQAAARVVEIARASGADTVAKSKSMVSEEIELNAALEEAGIRPVETDLGEFIVQLRGEKPAHIITPAIHLRRQDVAQTFHEQLGTPYTTDVKEMTAAARRVLRQVFLSAQVGVSGVNFGVAETGTLCLVTNEGNGRMVTTLPPIHIALMGIERVIPRLEDLGPMLDLLPRSATGQKLTSYVSLIQGPRREQDPDGAEERHLILVDNGRSRIRESDLSEILLCIRCGACLNACPVYREAGGHAYGSIYPGPIGSVISPGLFGLKSYGHLAKASTLCGACKDACPVDIDLPSLLLRVRASYSAGQPQTAWMRVGMRLYTWVMTDPRRYRISQRIAGMALRLMPRRQGWVRWLPPPLSAWTGKRDFPVFARRMLRDRDLDPGPRREASARPQAVPHSTEGLQTPTSLPTDLPAAFEAELVSIGGIFVRCTESQLPEAVVGVFKREGISRALTWGATSALPSAVHQGLRLAGVQLLDGVIPLAGPERKAGLESLDVVEAGLTGAQAGLAESATLILPGGPGRPMSASLLPWLHVCLLPATRLFKDLETWLKADGRAQLALSSSIALITGPSRTADIEMTLTRGVHGPGKVIVICYE